MDLPGFSAMEKGFSERGQGGPMGTLDGRGQPSPVLRDDRGPTALNGTRQSRKAEREPRVGVCSGRRRANPLGKGPRVVSE